MARLTQLHYAWFAVTLFLCPASAAQELVFRTLAGPTAGGGYADGIGAAARFSGPTGVAACGGAIFVADQGNHAIRRVGVTGEVTTWAGALSVAGSTDGPRATARFRGPGGIAADAQCNLYVADTENHTIRRISANGDVSTLAGKAGEPGDLHGRGSAARFNGPTDVAVDSSGAVYVSDSGNHIIRRVAPDGQVTLVAGRSGSRGFTDGPGENARFDFPLGIGLDPAGTLYVSDLQNRRIRRIGADRQVSTVNSTLFWASDVAVGCDGKLYSADRFNFRVVAVQTDGSVSSLAGLSGQQGLADGDGEAARFDLPRAIALDGDCSLIVIDESDGIVRRVTTSGHSTTIAGSAPERAHRDGKGTDARFISTVDVDVDAAGMVYVVGGGTVRRIAPDGTVSTLTGSPAEFLHRDGNAVDARFTSIGRVSVDPTGGLVVGDGPVIRRVSPSGEVTTIAGAPGKFGYRDGPGAEALFQTPLDLVVGNDGAIYVSETLNKAIRKIVGNTVTTLHRDTALGVPRGIDIDDQGIIYFWDENVPSVFRLTADGTRTTLFRDDALFSLLEGLALGPDGTVYVGGFRIHSIRRLTTEGKLDVFAGSDLSRGNQNGPALAARFRSPGHFAFGSDGRIYVADSNSAIRVGSASAPPVIVRFTSTPHADGSATLSWESTGGTSARIDPGVGAVPLNGSLMVQPATYTRYTLSVTGEGGVATAEVAVGLNQRRRPARR